MKSPQAPDYLTSEQLELFAKLADLIVRRRLTVPTVLFLESVRPLNYVATQAMIFFSPFVHALFDIRQYDLIRQALDRRETLGYLCDLLEAQEEELLDRLRADKAAKKAKKQSAGPKRRWFK